MVSRLLPSDEVILSALNKAKDDLLMVGGRPEVEDFCADTTLYNLKEQAELHMVGDILVAYVVDTPWFAKSKVLVELLVLRLGKRGKFRDVIEFFEAEARLLGCDRVAVGTLLAASDEALGSVYQRHGFHTSSWQLMKEV